MVGAISAENIHDRKFYEEKFFNWLSEHKFSPESGDHFVRWLQNFADNDDIIETHNSKKLPYTLGHNKFSHLSFEEWKQFVRLGLDRPADDTKADFIHEEPKDLSATPSKRMNNFTLFFCILFHSYRRLGQCRICDSCQGSRSE